ncbi:Crp/Fnr family transcriptional regulator [Niveibacterium sp.]|uniref:Crp/Fnr family transcriptional regulator n=1 Tax=Niveibacterium sp. TaxID=2017444 RepID=UPI0035AF08E5
MKNDAPLSPSVLKDDILEAIAAHGGVRTFPAHSVLINEEDETDSIFILLSGRVKVFGASAQGREVIYNTLGPGEYFGEMSLDGGPRSASVMTLEPTTCVVVAGSKVRDFLGKHPDFALHLIRKLIGLVRHSTDNVKSLALDDVYSRVARLLNDRAREVDGRLMVADKLTQQDIADHVGSSREMISRIFKQLTTGGYIALEGKQIVLLKKLPAGW